MTRFAAQLALAATTLAFATSNAPAQFTAASTVTFGLTFSDFGGNSNGTLEPGESALLRLSISFTNQNGTAASIGPLSGSGTIRGFGIGLVDIVGTPAASANGSWNLDPALGYGVRPPWDIAGNYPGPYATGSTLNAIVFGQFPRNVHSTMTTNPIDVIWQTLWTPLSYTPRTISFTARDIPEYSAGVWIETDDDLRGVWCGTQFIPVTIPIIPAPATCALLAPLLLACRRRPRAEPSP